MSEAKEKFKEVKIPVPWGHVSGKWWGPRGKQPILALHGWQDNAGTYDTLAALLPDDISLLAIDFPGHGLSSHYPAGQNYYLFWDGIVVVRRIAKHFRWNKISLIGHSMGGGIAFLYAASFPNDVEKLICIDIASPTIKDNESVAAMTGTIVDRFLQYENLSEEAMPCYSYREMVDLVFDAYQGSVTRSSAEIIVKRGMTKAPENSKKRPAADGYLFSRDLRLKVSGLGLITLDLVLEYASRITCQYMNIKGSPGMVFDHPEYYSEVLDAIRESACRFEYHEIPGTHHLHLNTPERVLPVIVKFLTTDKTEEPVNGKLTKVAPDPTVKGAREPSLPGCVPPPPPSTTKKSIFPAPRTTAAPSESSTPTKEPSTSKMSNGANADADT